MNSKFTERALVVTKSMMSISFLTMYKKKARLMKIA